MILVTGDIHGDLTRVIDMIEKMSLNQNDTIIILRRCGHMLERCERLGRLL